MISRVGYITVYDALSGAWTQVVGTEKNACPMLLSLSKLMVCVLAFKTIEADARRLTVPHLIYKLIIIY